MTRLQSERASSIKNHPDRPVLNSRRSGYPHYLFGTSHPVDAALRRHSMPPRLRAPPRPRGTARAGSGTGNRNPFRPNLDGEASEIRSRPAVSPVLPHRPPPWSATRTAATGRQGQQVGGPRRGHGPFPGDRPSSPNAEPTSGSHLRSRTWPSRRDRRTFPNAAATSRPATRTASPPSGRARHSSLDAARRVTTGRSTRFPGR